MIRCRDFLNARVFAVLLVCVAGAPEAAAAQTAQPPGVPTTFTFTQALQYALDHYPSLRAALEQLNASVANVTVARSAYLPRFDSFWQSSRATANNIFGQLLPQPAMPSISGPVLASASSRAVWGSAAGGLFSWEPFDLGLRAAAVSEAEASLVRTRADAAVTRLSVQNAVGVAFLAVVNAEQAMTSTAADVERREVLARSAHALADNQLRPGAEASRADAELAAARTRLIQARQSLIVAQATLGQMLGIADGPVAADTTRLLEVPGPPIPQPSTEPEHPLIESSRTAIDLARAREMVLAKTDRPRLYLQSALFARGSGANPDGSFDGGADGLGFERANWSAGVQLIFPNLFDFASLRARRTGAGALTRAEIARHDEAVLRVTAQQRMAAALVDAARDTARNTPIQLAAAQQAEAQARARYEAGLASIVEVAEAQNLLAAAEYQNAVARVDVWRALLAEAVAHGDVTPFIQSLRSAGVP